MKRLRAVFFGFLFVSVLAIPASAKELIVATSGNDANVGTLAAPLLTIKKAAALAAPGDTISVRGGVYYGQVAVAPIGTASARITIRSYPGEKAIIDGSVTAPGTDLFTMYRPQYVDVIGFEVRNSTRIGICVYGGKNIRILNNDIHHSVRGGVYVSYSEPGVSSDITIDGNEIHENVLENEFQPFGSGGWAGPLTVSKTERATITNNHIYKNYGEAGAGASTDVLIEGNVISDGFSVALYIDNGRRMTINRNLIYSTGDTRFYRFGQPAIGIGVANEAIATAMASSDNVFTNNIVVNARYGFYYGAYENGGGLINTTVANNTFYKATDAMIRIEQDTHSGSLVTNNIFHQVGGQGSQVAGSGVTYANNLWYGATAGSAAGAGDLYADPMFVKPGTNVASDYRLKDHSPAIFAATATGPEKDFFGTPRTAAFDIGAHEYSTSTGSGAPSAPALEGAANLRGSATSSSVSLLWDASPSGLAGYRVYRNGSLAATVTGTSWTDSGRAASTTWRYEVVGFDAIGNLAPASNVLTITTAAAASGDTQKPTAPASLRVAGSTSTSVTLSWSAATDNVGVVKYFIYRNGELYASSGTNAYTATGLERGHSYVFHVVAVDAAGNASAASNSVTATTLRKRRSA